MKKLVFAIQVFGVIALFPFVVILELNRSNTEIYSTSFINKHAEMKNVSLPGNVTGKLQKDVFPATVKTILLQAFKK